MPIFADIMSESYIVLRCERVARIHGELDDKIHLESLHSPMAKRIFVWITVNVAEMVILTALCFVGPQLM
jgi:hypothetical protein